MSWIMHSIDFARLRAPEVRAIFYIRVEGKLTAMLLGEPVIIDDNVITQAKIDEIIKKSKL